MEINLVKIDGKGFEKLVSTVSSAIGILYEPTYIRKVAQVEADKLKIIAVAKMEIQSKEVDAQQDRNDKILARTQLRELKRQNNIDKIVEFAASDISNDNDVSDNPVDEDWITRFFNYAQDISNEEAQLLWGKLLSNEVKKPGSFSLRTIEILRNISPSEAQLFQSLCEFVLMKLDKSIGFIYINSESFNNMISYGTLLILKECGLIDISSLAYNSKSHEFNIIYDNKILYAKKNDQEMDVKIKTYNLTKSGLELFLINSQKTNQAYFNDFVKYFKETYKPEISIYADFKLFPNNGIVLGNYIVL